MNLHCSLENRIPIYNYVEKHIYGWLHEIDCSLSIWAMNAMKNDDVRTLHFTGALCFLKTSECSTVHTTGQ